MNLKDAKSLNSSIMIIDMHSDILWRLRKTGESFMDQNQSGHSDYWRLKSGGVDLAILAIYVPRTVRKAKRFEYALKDLETILATINNYPDILSLVQSKMDLKKVKPGRKHLSIMLCLEGVDCLSGDFNKLRILYNAGVRMVTLTHNYNNEIGEACQRKGDGYKNGLSPLGRKWVSEMEDMGITIDLSHAHDRTVNDVIRICRKSPVISHTGCRSIFSKKRNSPDEIIKLVAEKEGIIGIDFCPYHMRPGEPSENKTSIVPDIAHQIKHAVSVAGINHVGIGSDFDGFEECIPGLKGAQDLPLITQALIKVGFSTGDITKILGANVLDLLKRNLPA